MVSNIDFGAIFPEIKNNFLHKIIIEFVNRLELNDQKYQKNGTVKD